MASLLIYLHGFNSSPQSLKAQQMAQYCANHRPDIKVVMPQLPSYPEEAQVYLEQLILRCKDEYKIGLVGSSLGGYLCTWLSERFALPAVLINPAVKPYELLVDYLGPQQNPYSGENYVLVPQHMAQLQQLDVATLHAPQRFWVLLQEGDEVLDYRQSIMKYAESKLTVEPNGDHSFVNFERFPASIIQFLEL
ncbi:MULTISPECIES: esterase YqiA [unclassified Photobacterium]|uniref:esterase YqiA n=1 Tax=unclassified Photobacterium TaxID=2628852 RepID=UPI000D165BF8|nr:MULTISPECIES: esterase YqiA [unclassified Photobacterium]PSV35978.1 esterase YqiA [Photobacterium sp. GB-27]PSV36074.1 esterase YqiA [Photobacterium sp. GB-210]PSV51919.1 esterase YqiA [Photobacterium sp. GB-1]PSV55824.1 esterase YqiA [Photobacterium sp. GB-3]PSW72762.1 esterase YqiA [Photobacterium sp. GB-50]